MRGHLDVRRAFSVCALAALLCGAVGGLCTEPASATAEAAGTFSSLAPARILDTRYGTGLSGAFAANQVRSLSITGIGGVPASGVDAVVLNVTATGANAAGFLTLFAAGQSLPNASNVNFVAGQTVPNLVVVKVGRGGVNEGKISIANTRIPTNPQPAAGTVQVIADVVGYYGDATAAAASRFTGLTPNRILDTRSNVGLSGAFGPNQVRDLTVTGNGVPANAVAVVMNVTVTGSSAAGHLTVYPAGQPLPNASNLNFVANSTVANLVVTKVGTNGQVSVANTRVPANPQPSAGSVHVIADVVGYFDASSTGSRLETFAPVRIVDTRTGLATPVQPNTTIAVDPHAGAPVPPVGGYTGVIVNIAVTAPTAAGHLTVYPSDATLPNASNLNFTTSQTVPNLVMVRVGADGNFKLANTRVPANPQPAAGTVHVVIDIVGYYTASAPSAPPPCGASGAPPAVYDHVVWIWMENHQSGQVIGSPDAPYETALAQQCGTATDYESVGAPSLPNYIGATSGSTQGIADDGAPVQHPVSADNLFRQVRARGLTERSYEDSMVGTCALSSAGRYAVKHNPAAYYNGGSDRTACQADDVPLGNLSTGALRQDLDAGTLPAFAFITPDLCNDTHDCSVATGDVWLQAWVPEILGKASGQTALFLVWDEPTPMPFVAVAASVPSGTVVNARLDHYSLLRTTEELLGISAHLGAASTATSMRTPFAL